MVTELLVKVTSASRPLDVRGELWTSRWRRRHSHARRPRLRIGEPEDHRVRELPGPKIVVVVAKPDLHRQTLGLERRAQRGFWLLGLGAGLLSY